MYIKTLKRMMIGRNIAQKGDELSVGETVGQSLIAKGAAIELESPKKNAAKPETKPETKVKASKDDIEDKAD